MHDRTGDLVQLSQFAKADLIGVPTVISLYNLSRTVPIKGVDAIGTSSGEVLTKIQELLSDLLVINIG